MHYAIRNLADRVRNAFVKRRFVTSLSDNGRYPQVCLDAAASVSTFRHFRRIRDYTAILEHVTPEQGEAYLAKIAHRPELLAALPRFGRNDQRPGIAPDRRYAWSPNRRPHPRRA